MPGLDRIADNFRRLITNATVSLNKNLSPLDIGDLVLLSLNSTLLHIVVGKPADLSSSTYTLINHEGEITYAKRSKIRLRVPQVILPELIQKLDLVRLERKFPDIAPIGMPDPKFTRSTAALPQALNRDTKIDEHENSIKASASESKSFNSDDDFIMAQATSQLLTNTDVQTYIVPLSARQLYSKALIDASVKAFDEVRLHSKRLRKLHTALQYDDNGRPLLSARRIPIFDLYEYESSHSDGGISSSGPILGKALPLNTRAGFQDTQYAMHSYLAFVIALLEKPRYWRVNFHKSSRVPLTVDVLPAQKAANTSNVLFKLKNGGIQEFTAFYVDYMLSRGKSGRKPAYYDMVVQLLKDFVAVNIANDHMLESVVGNLLRNIDKGIDEKGISVKRAAPYSVEYSRSRAYEVIMSLERTNWTNPIRWSLLTNLAGSQTSAIADLSQHYYDYIDWTFKSKADFEDALRNAAGSKSDSMSVTNKWILLEFHTTDPMKHVREDFGDTPVYCIDSETAHEIDDGISIKEIGLEYRITVHVADPTSYIRKESSLAATALEKGTTMYFPEGPSFMMPGLMAKMCGLDATGPNRSFASEFRVPKAPIDSLACGDLSLMTKDIWNTIVASSRIKFYTIHNAPRGFTYANVNKILDTKDASKKLANGEYKKGSHEWNLFKLYQVCQGLSLLRTKFSDALDFSPKSYKTTVDYAECSGGGSFQRLENGFQLQVPPVDKECGSTTPVIKLEEDTTQNETSKSQALVSTFMIMANHGAADFAKRNGVPIILRTQEMRWSKQVEKEVQEIMQKFRAGKKVTVEEQADMRKFMSAANYEVNEKGHRSLGLSLYLHFTSPLRRYADMVNQWILGDFICGREMVDKETLAYVANHLQMATVVSRDAQVFSNGFWQGTFLKHYFDLKQKGEIKKGMEFEFVLLSDAKFGDVRAEMKFFQDIKVTVVSTEELKRMFNEGKYEVGQTIKTEFVVRSIDFIEQEFVVEFTCK